MFALNQISYQNLLHVYILLFKEHFKISSEMTLFIEFHVYIYIVYAYFFISPFRNCMYFRFTNHSGRCDWDVCFIRNDLTYTKVISGQYQIKWVMFIALFFCGFSDISLPCISLTTITLFLFFGIHNYVLGYLEFLFFFSR